MKTLLEKTLLALKPIRIDRELIRIGCKGDGGYLCPDDLKGIGACVSPGAFNTKTFEDDLYRQWQISSLLIDPTSDEELFSTPMMKSQILIKKWLAAEANSDSITLEDALMHPLLRDSTDLLLQMDIEGAEYANILSWDATIIKRFRILVVELHGLDALQRPWRNRARQIMNSILKINKTHKCLHIHPNNCCGEFPLRDPNIMIPNVLECTFIRRDRLPPKNQWKQVEELPHLLDSRNVAELDDLRIDKSFCDTDDHFLERLKKGRLKRMQNSLKIESLAFLRKFYS